LGLKGLVVVVVVVAGSQPRIVVGQHIASPREGYLTQMLCPFCDQEDETVQHILVSCVFAREVWSLILQRLELLTVAPQAQLSAVCFTYWWCKALILSRPTNCDLS
jgi:hypothetical protein